MFSVPMDRRNGALVDALILELLQCLLGVRSGGRVDHEALCVGHIGQQS